jgi:predicted transcriptional regulator
MDSADLATSIRLPGDLVARADALAERRAVLLGERASRSAVLRLAIERGIATLEREAAELEAPSTRAALLAELDALRERVAVLGGNDGR